MGNSDQLWMQILVTYQSCDTNLIKVYELKRVI